MYSITGYFFDGSNRVGFHTRPQMSVAPSRPLATNTSGAFQPALTSAVMSPFSISAIERWLSRRSATMQLEHARQIDARVVIDVHRHVGRELDRVIGIDRGERRQAGAVEIDAVVVLEVRILARRSCRRR